LTTRDATRNVTGSERAVARIFYPSSIAIVGASGRPGALSWVPLHLLQRYQYRGAIYPVNPARESIDGIACYPTLADVPGPIDLAVIVVNAEATVDAVQQCADLGVAAAVLPAQGLGEQGGEAREREREMAAYAGARGLRIVGPNTDGVANLSTGAMATIQPVFQEMIASGPLAVVAQSGATAASIVLRLKHAGIGCRYYASAGNEIDLGLADYLSFVLQDPEVRMVVSYVEAVRRADDFLRAASLAAELGKPIALLKVGASQQGALMAAAHTGALAGSDAIHDAIFREYGILRVTELSELTAIAKLFLARGASAARGVGIVSVSGGQAGALSDKAVGMGLGVPGLEPGVTAQLAQMLKFTPPTNPCDLDGQIATEPDIAARAYRAMSSQPGLGTIVYARKLLTGQASAESAAAIAAATMEPNAVPLAVYAMDGSLNEAEQVAYRSASVPVFDSAQELFGAVRALCGYADCLTRRAGRARARPAPRSPAPTTALTEAQARGLLAGYRIPVPAEALATDANSAVAAAERIGYPVVMKVISDRILHKTELGGVALSVADAESVRVAFARLRALGVEAVGEAHIDGVLVQEQVGGGVEMIAGVKVDEQFGPFVMLGLGGIATELLKDIVLRPAPVSPNDVREMVGELRGSALLHGFRGGDMMDVSALAAAVSALSEFAADHATQISEVDLNPIIVLPVGRGVRVVDVVIVPTPSPP
jgi:acyl-CoA synthetase (NDP forming)